MTKRPDNVTYAVDDLPPLLSLVFLGLQQVALIGIYLAMVVIVVRAARAPQEVAENAISFTAWLHWELEPFSKLSGRVLWVLDI